MNLIEVGKIVNTHGLKGEIKAVSWCDYPEIFEDFSAVYIRDKQYDIESVRYHKESVILKLSGIDDVNLAEKYKNSVMYVERSEFELPEGTYFIADIIGLKVYEGEAEIGVISDVIQTGANDVYVIKREGKRELLLPVTPETLLETNLAEGFVKISIPEGLDEI